MACKLLLAVRVVVGTAARVGLGTGVASADAVAEDTLVAAELGRGVARLEALAAEMVVGVAVGMAAGMVVGWRAEAADMVTAAVAEVVGNMAQAGDEAAGPVAEPDHMPAVVIAVGIGIGAVGSAGLVETYSWTEIGLESVSENGLGC